MVFDFVAAAVAIWVPMAVFQQLCSRRVLGEWAARAGLRLTHVERRWFAMGPFVRLPLRGPVFRITAEDRGGKIRTGFVLANASFDPPVDVEWD
jgi:hypothetical protein